MAKRRSRGPKPHLFRYKLLLNQWLIGLFGIDLLGENKLRGQEGSALSLAYTPRVTLARLLTSYSRTS
jgi:hypothetical protein